MVDTKKLAAAVSPDVLCDPSVKSDVKKIVKSDGYIKAAEKAKLKKSDYLDIPLVRLVRTPFDKDGLKQPIEQHQLEYKASSHALEPMYFWFLDYSRGEFNDVEKLTDNFVASPGSGHFAEMSRRATVLQDEAMKLFGTINTVIRSVLNIIYDMKEFKLRLAQYDDYNSGDKRLKQAARYALKQIWMDSVDIKRGNSSIKGMAQQFDYVTLIDAFMAADSLDDASKLDLNDRVKRILMQRIPDFERWVKESEVELRKRYEVEKIYLRSQVNSVKLYAQWLKPHLENARQLQQNAEIGGADIVSQFNTAVFELKLLGKSKYDPAGDIASGALPVAFKYMKLRNYYAMCLIELKFRSIPERSDQRGGYGFVGNAEVTLTSFALNDDELKAFKEAVAQDDFGEVYRLISGSTDDSLQQIQTDINELLGEKSKEEKKKEEEKDDKDVNPFSALFSFLKKDEKDEKKDLSKGVPPDNDYEKILRNMALIDARWKCRRIYDNYKKSNNMPAFPPSQS